MTTPKTPVSAVKARRPWEPPAVKTVGTIGSVLRQGNGKFTTTVGDPGEPRKVDSSG
jgi:hypothetical protein